MGLRPREPALTRDTTVSSTPPAFGRFRVVHQVGAGVHGPVFLATDPEGDRQVVVKAFPLDITPERAATLAAALRQLVSTPLGHPSIVRLLDAGSEGSTVYLAQEYVLAESVDAALREYGPAPVPDALRLIGQLAGAIDFAAVASVHHGALHPRDVLVAPNEVRLTGLGIAGAFEQIGLRVAARRPYSAPERHDRRAWGTAADVFSLAAVAFEMLTGRRPGSAEAIAADTRSIPAPNPAALAEVFARAMSARPDDRFQTALAFAASLRHALTGEPIELPGAAAAAEPVVAAVREPVPVAVPVLVADAAPEDEEEQVLPEEEEGAPAEEEERAPAEEEERAPAEEEERTPVEEEERAPERAAAGEPVEDATPPELAVFAPERQDEAEPAAANGPADAPGEPPVEIDEPAPRTIDAFRATEPAPEPEEEEDRAGGPVELGEDAASPPAEPPLLPLEIAMEPEPPVRPVVPPPRVEPPPAYRPEAALPPRRTRFPLSSLLAMLLVGIVAGFVVGYFLGRGDRSVRQAGPAAEAVAPVASPSGGDPTLSKVPPSEVARPEPAAQPSAVPPPPTAEAQEPARPAVSPPAPAGASASRRSAPAEEADEEPDGPFEAPLAVISRPAGALVRLDGRAVGKTPVRLSSIRAGAHVVRLELQGYLPWTSAIQVVSGAQNRVTASLERRPGGIE